MLPVIVLKQLNNQLNQYIFEENYDFNSFKFKNNATATNLQNVLLSSNSPV